MRGPLAGSTHLGGISSMKGVQMEGSYEEPQKEPVEESRNESSQWVPWQIVSLVVVVALAILYVAGVIVDGNGNGGDGKTQVAPSNTPPWPTVITNTPLPTLTPTSTPGPTHTPTLVPSPTPTTTPTPTPTNTPIVVIIGVNALGRLETSRYVMQTIVEVKDEASNVIEEISGDKLLLIAEGEVVAGFDLQKVQSSDIVVQGTSVSIILPPPEILYSRVDNDKTYVYGRETGLLRRPDPDLETKARRLAEERLVNWALEREILVQAEEYGKFYLENFLRSLGLVEIEIKVQDSE